MSAIAGFPASVLGPLLFALAPVPPEAAPDPMGRGYMGVSVRTGGLTVDTVYPNMPAAKAGLRPGDVLLKVGVLEPRGFDEVVAHVCSFRPGAVVEIQVQRGTERKTFRVKLVARPPELDLPVNPPPIWIDD